MVTYWLNKCSDLWFQILWFNILLKQSAPKSTDESICMLLLLAFGVSGHSFFFFFNQFSHNCLTQSSFKGAFLKIPCPIS